MSFKVEAVKNELEEVVTEEVTVTEDWWTESIDVQSAVTSDEKVSFGSFTANCTRFDGGQRWDVSCSHEYEIHMCERPHPNSVLAAPPPAPARPPAPAKLM